MTLEVDARKNIPLRSAMGMCGSFIKGEGERPVNVDVKAANAGNIWVDYSRSDVYESISERMRRGKKYTIGQLCLLYGIDMEMLLHILAQGSHTSK